MANAVGPCREPPDWILRGPDGSDVLACDRHLALLLAERPSVQDGDWTWVRVATPGDRGACAYVRHAGFCSVRFTLEGKPEDCSCGALRPTQEVRDG